MRDTIDKALGIAYGIVLAISLWAFTRKVRHNQPREQQRIEAAKRRSEDIDDWSELKGR